MSSSEGRHLRSSRARAAALGAFAAALIWAPAAAAATRYASPVGDASDPSCPAADPCDIETAVEHASVMTGDEVIVLPGLHDIGAEELTVGQPGGKAIDVHGAVGEPRPEIRGTGTTVVRMLASATVSDLAITAQPAGGSGAALRFDTNFIPTAERLLVYAEGTFVVACTTPLWHAGANPVLRDSVCHADGPGAGSAGVGQSLSAGGPGTLTLSGELVNVTAIGTDGAYGLNLEVGSNADLTLNATNVIARSDTGIDVRAEAFDATGTATVSLDHSSYATEQETEPVGSAEVTDPGSSSNQTAAPAFVDASGGDFHQSAVSQTINAGTAADPLLGSLDLDRDQRVIGPAPDIGADELAPPAEPPPPTCKGQPATRVGTPGPDAIPGTAGRDVVVALGGADRVFTGPGNDLVCAGPGADRVSTGAGVDRVLGEGGADRILGGGARDFIFGQGGFDRLIGGAGGDRLFGGARLDRLFGGPGFDRLFGGPGHDRAFGGAGRDLLVGAGGRDRLFGGPGRDALRGGPGRPDRCFGGPGRDVRWARGCEVRRSIR